MMVVWCEYVLLQWWYYYIIIIIIMMQAAIVAAAWKKKAEEEVVHLQMIFDNCAAGVWEIQQQWCNKRLRLLLGMCRHKIDRLICLLLLVVHKSKQNMLLHHRPKYTMPEGNSGSRANQKSNNNELAKKRKELHGWRPRTAVCVWGNAGGGCLGKIRFAVPFCPHQQISNILLDGEQVGYFYQYNIYNCKSRKAKIGLSFSTASRKPY